LISTVVRNSFRHARSSDLAIRLAAFGSARGNPYDSTTLPSLNLHIHIHQEKLNHLTAEEVFFLLVDRMPSSDYSSATGGALKLKGSSGVDKKKKKKKVAKAAADSTGDSAGAATSSSAAAKADKKDERDAEDDERISKALADEDGAELSDDAKKELAGVRGKTDAEKRYEEMRRKRV